MARARRSTVRRLASTIVAAGALLSLSGCVIATDPSPEPSSTEPTTSAASPTDVEPSDAEPGEDASTTAEPTPPADEDLPGELVDGFPEAGTALTIVGVDATEILNLRIGPGIDYDAIARMPPDTALTATGRNRDLGGGAGVWYQVRAADDVGWVISSYVAELGASREVTDRFDPAPSGDSSSALVEAVVNGWSASDGYVVVYGPVVIEDLQVRIDVFGGDGSVLGSRLFVVAAEDGGTFTVTKVTATQLCAQGVSGTGECL